VISSGVRAIRARFARCETTSVVISSDMGLRAIGGACRSGAR
jgi:hypothetical protein